MNLWHAHAERLEAIADQLVAALALTPCSCDGDCPRCSAIQGMVTDLEGEARMAFAVADQGAAA